MKPEHILLDVHTHTIASGHAFSSLQEMVHAAAEKDYRSWELRNTHQAFRAHAAQFTSEICMLYLGKCMVSNYC